MPTSPAFRYLDAAGHRLGAYAGGDASDPRLPLVLFHGITHSARFWPPNLPSAARDGRRWASVSLPAHYPSRLPRGTRPGDITAGWWAAYVDEAARALYGEAPYVPGGFSTGGFAALCAAIHRPERVRGVLAVSAFVRGRWGGLLGAMQGLALGGPAGRALFKASAALSPRSAGGYGRLLETFARSPLDPERFRETVEAVRPDVLRHDAREQATLFAGIRPLDITADLARITAPTLVVHGERDTVPLREAHAVAERVPGARLVLLPGAGHLFFAEAFQSFDESASAWLRGLGEEANSDATVR